MMLVKFKLERRMFIYLYCDWYEVKKKKRKKKNMKWKRNIRKRKNRKIKRKALKKKNKKSRNNVMLISEVCWCEICDEE